MPHRQRPADDEARRTLEDGMRDDWEPPPGPHGPYHSPIDRFAMLREDTRAWLEGLGEEDIAELKEAVKFQRSARTIGRFGRWLTITIVTAFIGAVTFGEKIQIAWKWVFDGGPR